MGGLVDAGALGLLWAALAAVAGLGLAAAAAFAARRHRNDLCEMDVGYDALAHVFSRCSAQA